MCHCRLTLHIQLLLAQSRGLQGHRNDSHWKTRIVGGVIKIQESRTCLKASAIVQCLKPCFDTALKSQDVKRRKSSDQTFAVKPAHCAETRHQHASSRRETHQLQRRNRHPDQCPRKPQLLGVQGSKHGTSE
jgi:hypothetical protein